MKPDVQNMRFQRNIIFWCFSLKKCESSFVRLSTVLLSKEITYHISVHKGQLTTIYQVVRLRQWNILAQVTSVSFHFEKFITGKQIILWTYCQCQKMLQLFDLTKQAVHMPLLQSTYLPVAEQQLCCESEQTWDKQGVMAHKLHSYYLSPECYVS